MNGAADLKGQKVARLFIIMRHRFIIDIRREAFWDCLTALLGQFLCVVREAVIFSRIFIKAGFGILDITAVIVQDLRP